METSQIIPQSDLDDIPVEDEMSNARLLRMQMDDYVRALENPLAQSLKPRAGRILATAPHVRAEGIKKRANSTLFLPGTTERHQQEYGLLCTVIRAGDDVAPEIIPGRIIVVPWFGGVVLLNETYEEYADLWLFGDSEVMLVHDSVLTGIEA